MRTSLCPICAWGSDRAIPISSPKVAWVCRNTCQPSHGSSSFTPTRCRWRLLRFRSSRGVPLELAKGPTVATNYKSFVGDTSGYEDSSESLLVKQVHVELPVSVARGDGRPPRIDRPLHANNLRIALRHILNVCERQIA